MITNVPILLDDFGPAEIGKVYESLGLNQAEFSRLVHVSPGTVNRWKQGTTKVDTYGAIILGMLWWLAVEKVDGRPRVQAPRLVQDLLGYRTPGRLVVRMSWWVTSEYERASA